MDLYVVGEDSATKEIVKRVIQFCSQDFQIIAELPTRGGQIKADIAKFNILAESNPVILLTDLDGESCSPAFLKKLFPNSIDKHPHFLLNIAVDEAEAWLMADIEGFSSYFHIPVKKMMQPQKCRFKGNRFDNEMIFPYKSSLYMLREIIPHSIKNDIRAQMEPINGSKKGPEYNLAISPFIQDRWNISTAMTNSDSLSRMIRRINNLYEKFKRTSKVTQR